MDESNQCEIDVRQVKSTVLDMWWAFVAVTPDREIITESEPFKSGRSKVDRRKQEMLHLDRFIADLESRAWAIARRPEPGLKRGWYRYGMVRDERRYVAPITRLPIAADSPWLTTQRMWMITIAIVIILFACCIFLAFSSELRFTAS